MPKLPFRESTAVIQIGRQPLRDPPAETAELRAGLRLGEAFVDLGVRLNTLRANLDRARQQRQIAEGKSAVARSLRQIRFDANQQANPEDALEFWNQGSSQTREQILGAIKDEAVRDTVELYFDDQSSLQGLKVQEESAQKTISLGLAVSDAFIDEQEQLAEVSGEDEYRQIQNEIAGHLSDSAQGELPLRSPEQAVGQGNVIFRRMDNARVDEGIRIDPEGELERLEDQAYRANLTPQDRTNKKGKAANRIVELMNVRNTEAERERKATERALKAAQTENALGLWVALAQDELTMETLIEQKDNISLIEFEKLEKIISREEAETDNDPVWNDLFDRMYAGEDVNDDILRAHEQGDIIRSTAASMLAKNREINRTPDTRAGLGRPRTPYDRHRKFMRDKLGARTVLTKFDFALEGRLADATREYDDFAIEHPSATAEDFRIRSDEIVFRYSRFQLEGTILGLKFPFGITNKKIQEITADDLLVAAQKLEAAHRSGKRTLAEFNREKLNLKRWTDALTLFNRQREGPDVRNPRR